MTKRPPSNYNDLKKMHLKQGKTEISYEDLLWTYEWLDCRNGIVERDKHTCTKCLVSKYKKIPQDEYEKLIEEERARHKKYFNLLTGEEQDQPGESPWDMVIEFKLAKPVDFIEDESLKLEVHHEYYIWGKLPWQYDKSILTTLCADCHEKEHMNKKRVIYKDTSCRERIILVPCLKCGGTGYLNEYKHVQNGVCFGCWGYGGVLEGTSTNTFKIRV